MSFYFNTKLSPTTPMATLVAEFYGYPIHMAIVNDDMVALDAALLAANDINERHLEVVSQRWQAEHTPLELAIILHRTRCVQRLIDGGADIRHTVFVVALYGSSEIMQIFMRANVDPNTADGNTTLCHIVAARRGALADEAAPIMRVLLAAGASCSKIDEFRELPIRRAVRHGSEQLVSLLLAATRC